MEQRRKRSRRKHGLFGESASSPLGDRLFRILNIVDDVTKQCLGAIPDASISGRRVAPELTAILSGTASPA